MKLFSIIHHLLEKAKNMKNSLTSRSKVKYYHDVNIETKEWEVIELPSRNIIMSYKFEEDAKNVCNSLNDKRPFGDYGFPKFLTYK